MTEPRTDRHALTTQAYGTDANLAARQSIYRYCDPPVAFQEWALDRVDWRGDECVVDVGCGNGAYFGPLRDRTRGTVVGFDLSAGMLASASGVPSAVADVQAVPLADDAVDVALAMHMLFHVPDIELAVSELRRALRPGGVLLAATNAAPHLRELNRVFTEAAELSANEPLRWSAGWFSLEDGADVLRTAFDDVRREDLPRRLVVPEVDPVVAYVDSTRSWREPLLRPGLSWEDCISRIRATVQATIEREGVFAITAHAGVFVCR